MTKVKINAVFKTKLRDETLLHFADKSTMGVLIIQRGYLQYFNQKFTEIFGYTKEDILQWKKREFYKIIHPEDLPSLIKNFKIEADKKTAAVRFRGVRKDNHIIEIDNYMCHIKYNNKTAYLSSYIPLEESFDELHIPKLIEIKTEKIIILDYQPEIVKLLADNTVKFEVIKHSSFREEY